MSPERRGRAPLGVPLAKPLQWYFWRAVFDPSYRRVDAYDGLLPQWTPFQRSFLAIAQESLSGDCRRHARRPPMLSPALIDQLGGIGRDNLTETLMGFPAFQVQLTIALESMLDSSQGLRRFCANAARADMCPQVLGAWAPLWCRLRRRLRRAARLMQGAEFFVTSALNMSVAGLIADALPHGLVVPMAGLANGKLGGHEVWNGFEHFFIVLFRLLEMAEILGREELVHGRRRVARAEFHPEAADVGFSEGVLHRADVLLWALEKSGAGGAAPRVAEIGAHEAECSSRLLASSPNLTWLGVDAYGTTGDYGQGGPEAADAPEWLQEARRRLSPWLGAGRAHLVVGDSAAAASGVAEGSLDLLFVDGDHSRQGAARDLKAWVPCVRPGGAVAGHDYSMSFPGVVEAAHDALPPNSTLHLSLDNVFWWYKPGGVGAEA